MMRDDVPRPFILSRFFRSSPLFSYVACFHFKPCEEYHSYVARKNCEYGNDMMAVYKELKTHLCRSNPDLYYVVRIDNKTIEVPICELLMGRRDYGDGVTWASFVHLHPVNDEVWCIEFEKWRYERFTKSYCRSKCPSVNEAIDIIVKAARDVFEEADEEEEE